MPQRLALHNHFRNDDPMVVEHDRIKSNFDSLIDNAMKKTTVMITVKEEQSDVADDAAVISSSGDRHPIPILEAPTKNFSKMTKTTTVTTDHNDNDKYDNQDLLLPSPSLSFLSSLGSLESTGTHISSPKRKKQKQYIPHYAHPTNDHDDTLGLRTCATF